jgi:hypothetical protein
MPRLLVLVSALVSVLVSVLVLRVLMLGRWRVIVRCAQS